MLKTKNFQDDYMSNCVVDEFQKHRIPGLDQKRANVIIDIIKGMVQGRENATPRILDIGCAAGDVTRLLAQTFDNIIGVDISSTQIAKALEIPCTAEFMTGTGENLPVNEGTIDIIISIFSLHYMDVPKFAEECNRVLKPGGKVICYMDTISEISSTDYENVAETTNLLKSMYEKYFELFKVFQHPQMHIIDRFESLINSIGCLNSRRSETKIENRTNLEAVKCHLMSVPIYGWQSPTVENPLVELVEKIKKMWSVENLETSSINVKVTYDVSLIILSRE